MLNKPIFYCLIVTSILTYHYYLFTTISTQNLRPSSVPNFYADQISMAYGHSLSISITSYTKCYKKLYFLYINTIPLNAGISYKHQNHVNFLALAMKQFVLLKC